MGDLKPIGSEKLTGQEKLKRIMEIATYKEAGSYNSKDLNSTEYSIQLSDGMQYQIVKEKMGYIIKKTISESEVDYIEPMKNRKYFSSYSQALKKLNLMAKELNRLNENEEGLPLFGEQKKFVLKTPKMDEPEDIVPAPEVPSEPPAVPSPDLPQSDDVSMEDELSVTSDVEDVSSEPVEPQDELPLPGGEGGPVTFKSIQKLTGKLTQKIREFQTEEGMTSEDMKYVINMVLSSLDLENLSDEDRDDILSKFESDEMGDEDLGLEPDMGGDSEDITSDSEVEDIQKNMDIPIESYMNESKIDKVISKYFEVSNEEKKIQEQKNIESLGKRMEMVRDFSETIEQELSSQKFLEENKSYKFLGMTNKGNLIFEGKKGKVKITPEGLII